MSSIIRFKDGQEQSIDALSLDELNRLFYEDAKVAIIQAKKCLPFSTQRKDIMSHLYTNHHLLSEKRRERANVSNSSLGAMGRSYKMICKLLKSVRKHEIGKIILYEVGVGECYIAEKFLNEKDVQFHGCDVHLSDRVKNMGFLKQRITEGDVIDAIEEMEDASIDILYADNVFEHFFPDEIEQVLVKINQKLKKGALIYLIIPNRYIGPADISRLFVPFGAKAEAHHMMEMSFQEVTDLVASVGWRHEYVACVHIPKTETTLYLKNHFRISEVKGSCESIFCKLPRQLRTSLFAICGYTSYVFKKQS